MIAKKWLMQCERCREAPTIPDLEVRACDCYVKFNIERAFGWKANEMQLTEK